MKYSRSFTFALFFLVLLGPGLSDAQTTFYDKGTVQEIELYFSYPDWDYQLDTAKAGAGGYIMADWVKINGVQFDSVGVKYKGSSSYDPAYVKNPLHISLDEYRKQSYQGFASIKLANCYGDPSMIREVLSYGILSDYMDCSRSNFASVVINGSYIGLYSNDESVNRKFCSAHFSSSGGTFIKCNPEVAGPFSKSNLKYLGGDSSDYFSFYEMESQNGWNDLVELCDIVTNDLSAYESTINIDRALWMLAFNNLLVSLDSYSGWFSQNHYMYRDRSGVYNPVIWDLNMSLGGFPFAGSPGGGSGALTVSMMQQMTPLLHDNHSDWPLIYMLMSNPQWRRMYIAHMRTIMEEAFVSGQYLEEADDLRTLIGPFAAADTNMFFTYEQFLAAMTADLTFGSYTVPGISNLMEARADYLSSLTMFTAVPPAISFVTPSNTSPEYGSEVTITALVTGNTDGAVFLGYRLDKASPFTRIVMYDDGLHNDGEAGDDVYGQSFIMTSLNAQYYIYSENEDAGMFSPPRAEHDYYNLQAQVQTAGPGEVVFNEFLARNVSDTVNEYGNHEDWIELYNMTDMPLSLFGLYLSDDFADPGKFAIPDSTLIGPYGFLIIWADEENSTSSYVHCNFKLSAGGEDLMLSDGAGIILDSLTFSAQQEDISTGRCPDGSGPFIQLASTTFNGQNACPASIHDEGPSMPMRLFPNPAWDWITIECPDDGARLVEIYSSDGRLVAQKSIVSRVSSISLESIPAGVYFLRLSDELSSARAGVIFLVDR